MSGESEQEREVRIAAAALRAGELVVLPTDTVYGLAAHPDVPGAMARLFEAKGRSRQKPIAVLVADAAAARGRGAAFGPAAQRLAGAFWPGALTLVLPVGQERQEGFRVPDHELALALIREVGGALYTTSANRSDESPAASPEEAEAALGPYVKVVIRGGARPRGTQSTVVRVATGNVEVLREGAVSREAIQRCLSTS